MLYIINVSIATLILSIHICNYDYMLLITNRIVVAMLRLSTFLPIRIYVVYTRVNHCTHTHSHTFPHTHTHTHTHTPIHTQTPIHTHTYVTICHYKINYLLCNC